MKSKYLFLPLLAVFAVFFSGCTALGGCSKPLSQDEIKGRVQGLFDERGFQGVEIKTVEEDENCMYKITVSAQGQEVDTYASKDGSKFFFEAVELKTEEEIAKEKEEQEKELAKQDPVNLPKQDKPEVELFVMSHCPYGTQIEKGIIPVVELLKDKIDFQLKFVDYAMHDDVEIKEQTREYCIQKDSQDKLIPYKKCFLEDSDDQRCIKQVGLDSAKIDDCMKKTDEEFGISKGYEDKTQWKGQFPPFPIYKEENQKYGVQGSPTLVINQTQISPAGRDSKNLLKAICEGFNEKPEECSQELSDQAPTPGFGYTQSGGTSTDASCS